MNNNIALVTGAAKGIGLATAKSLLSEGFQVIMLDREPVGITQFNEKDKKRITIWNHDVQDSEVVRKSINAFEKERGVISVLVNNAGIGGQKIAGVLNITPQEWEATLNINLTSAMRLCQWVLPAMQRQKYGRIINIASLAGRSKSIVAGVGYMASKAGVLGLTRAIASEMAAYGITANAIAPGRVASAMAGDASTDININYAKQIPVQRIGQPEEIAQAVLFLCGKNSGFINGSVLDINGGFFMS